MADDKKPEELSEDDLGAVTGGRGNRFFDEADGLFGKSPGKGPKPGSKPPVGTQAGTNPDD